LRFLIILIAFTWALPAQEVGFVPNAGQWTSNFDFRLSTSQGYIYLTAQEQRVLMIVSPRAKRQQDRLGTKIGEPKPVKGHAYSIRWINANPDAEVSTKTLAGSGKLNYLLGNDPQYWASDLKQYQELTYHNIYPNIDLRYYLIDAGICAFDFIIHPGGEPNQIKWQIEGVEQQGILSGDITLMTSLGAAVYSAPYAFQAEEKVEAQFLELGPGIYGFQVGDYAKDETLIIDPKLIFSTYSGSTIDNYAMAATFGEGGTGYGSGIVDRFHTAGRNGAFPTTLGAFQDSAVGGRSDAVIAKYSADGSSQVYATYLGGSFNDIPISLLEGPNKSLYVFGVTGSFDFPTATTGYDTSFAFGSFDDITIGPVLRFPNNNDVFLIQLDSIGGSLLGGTFLGDSVSDGVNKHQYYNWGDGARGDISLDTNGNVLICGSTFSTSLVGDVANTTSYGGLQDGFVASFSPNLQNLNWVSYLGGSLHDAAMSLKVTPSNRLYATGMSDSRSVSANTIGAYQDMNKGGADVFVTEIDPSNGSILKWTFSGTPEHDRAYFIDYTPQGGLVIFGQTKGIWPQLGDSVWGIAKSSNILQEFSPDLSTVSHSTCFGDSTRLLSPLNPQALMVSECGDIFLSGTGTDFYAGIRGISGFSTVGLEVTHDAYRSVVDSLGDVYLMRLDASWTKLEYGSFFGGLDHWEWDRGGNARFNRDGKLVQSISACISLNGFPTTPNAFSPVRASPLFYCNMATFQFDLEAYLIDAKVELAPGYTDSVCLPGAVKFVDRSFNSSITFIVDSQGNQDTLRNQVFPIQDSGFTNFQIIAIDTVCNLVDTSYFPIYGIGETIKADFEYDYDSCDASGLVRFNNRSQGASRYQWFFGDGDSAQAAQVSHTYPAGTYTVQLIVEEPHCNYSDTLFKEITVRDLEQKPQMISQSEPCNEERFINSYVDKSSLGTNAYQVFQWYLNDRLVEEGDTLSIPLSSGGSYYLKLVSQDTICNRSHVIEDTLFFYDERIEPQFPNIFTPNGDGLNDVFGIINQEEVLPFWQSASLEVYSRNGAQLFSGGLNKLQWEGKQGSNDLPDGVYFYVLSYEDICGKMNEAKGFVHLQR
jgi:gliding motility-associated-like protein